MLQVLMQMKKFSLIPLLLLLLAAASCEFEFDVRNDADPGIYLSCVSSPDSAVVYVSYASRLGVNADDIPKLVVKDAELTAGGRKQSLDLKGETLSAKYPASIHEGERVGIRLSCEGLGSVEASTLFPAEYRAVKLKESVDEMGVMKIFSYELSLDRQPREGDYLAVSIIRMISQSEQDKDPETQWLHLNPMVNTGTDPTLEVAQLDFDISAFKIVEKIRRSGNYSQKDSLSMTIVPARAFKDGSCSLTVMDVSGMMPPRPGDVPAAEKPVQETLRYIVKVFGVSEDFYRYSLAHYKSKTDFLAQMGLAPAQFAWSNVRGGFGFCGAIRVNQTLFDPDPDNKGEFVIY